MSDKLILVLNCGSSSLKGAVVNKDNGDVLLSCLAEKLNLPDAYITFKINGNKERVELSDAPNHTGAVGALLQELKKHGLESRIGAVGHRVVSAGEEYSESVLIDGKVIDAIERCIPLAPLHNPANLLGIRAAQEIFKGLPNVAVFDTAYHQTMPEHAYTYAIPRKYYRELHLRRYGFHGTSYRFVADETARFLGKDLKSLRLVIAHLGNGASIAAIKNGQSQDTSMGLTPLEGLVMGTRSGDVDPGALPFIMHKENLDADGLAELLNKKSGMAGFSEISSDMRDIEGAIESGNKRAALALAIYDYRIKKYIGAYAAALGGLDILVFTGGVGENQDSTREVVCRDMEFLGLEFDAEKNRGVRGREVVLSKPSSRVKVLVVPTDEEYMIASDTCEILKGK